MVFGKENFEGAKFNLNNREIKRVDILMINTATNALKLTYCWLHLTKKEIISTTPNDK
jgi:hypothetical protein